MKRRELIRHLEAHGCRLKREGAEHTLYHNPSTGEMQAIPRHTEVADILAKKICRRLSVPDPN
jgi:mRNA interferase HicA